MDTILGMNRKSVLRSSTAYVFVSATLLSAYYVSTQRPAHLAEPVTASVSEPLYSILTVNLDEELTQQVFLQSVGAYMDAQPAAYYIRCGLETCDVAVPASMPESADNVLTDVNALVSRLRESKAAG